MQGFQDSECRIYGIAVGFTVEKLSRPPYPGLLSPFYFDEDDDYEIRTCLWRLLYVEGIYVSVLCLGPVFKDEAKLS